MQRTLNSVRAGCLAVALSVSASAQFDPHLFRTPQVTAPIPHPNVDLRRDADGRAVDDAVRAIAAARTSEREAARALALRELGRRVPALSVDWDDVYDTPHFVRSTLGFLTPPVAGGAGAAEEVLLAFLDEQRGLFDVSPGELGAARLDRDFVNSRNGVRHLTWKQQHEGVELFGCELRASVTAAGELINVSSTLLRRPDGGFRPSARVITDHDAIVLAAASVGILVDEIAPATAPEGPSERRAWSRSAAFRADEPVTTELVLFALTRDDLRSAWKVVVPEIGIGNTYETMVDATTGAVLFRWNRLHFALGGTQPITFNVFPTDSPAPGTPGNPTPNGFQFPVVPRQLVTVNPGDVAAWSPNHWIDDGGNETLGNNVDAHLDLNADNVADLPRPTGAPARTFDFPCDVAQAPSTYRNAAVTQMFYLVNRYHDRLMSFGFDEAAKNFQQTNFSGQGTGNDRVQADGQDGSGTNNANFGTNGTDGSTGRMQMYVFTGPTPDRDGTLDADIIYHELSHGLSIRLLDGFAFGEQAGGMGEGWGDFFGTCLNAEPTDDPHGVYTTGGWTVYQLAGLTENYYYGIRRFPYSTDLNKNPQTYADIDPAQQNYPPAVPRSPIIGNTADEVHNVGEVWCVTLLDCRANLWATHGFAANDLIMELVVAGLMLSPATPNFLQARDAILQADIVANGGANLLELWTGFARRGMGASATSPAGSTTTGIVEAYDVPNMIVFAYPNGRPEGHIAPAAPITFQVRVIGVGSATPTPGTGQLSYRVNGGSTTTVAMTQTSANNYDATLPAFGCLDEVEYSVSAGSNLGTASDPQAAPAVMHTAFVATGEIDEVDDDFETDQGWIPGNLGASSGNWERGTPVNDPNWAYDPTGDGDGSGQCWLTQNAIGNTDVDNGAVQLTSTLFDFSGPSAVISYEYYLFLTNEDGSDRLLVEIDPNGGPGPWTPIATHDVDGGTGWRHHEITAETVQGLGVALTATTRVRFTANDGGTASIVEAGVDGFRVRHAVCAPPPAPFCFGDGTGAACPCGNNGAPGEGCANSLGNGGLLTATGSSSVAVDTLLLSGSGMPNASALYFQGTSTSGVAFGDGLRCAGGTIIRLATKTNAGGMSSYPEGGDQPVSVRGLVPAGGGDRYYQCWYRNAAAFCTASTFNLTNGVAVSWQP